MITVVLALLSLVKVVGGIGSKHECEITIQTYGMTEDSNLVGFIKVFDEYVMEWSSNDKEQGWFMVELGPACDVISTEKLDKTDSPEALLMLGASVLRGNYILGATANGIDVLLTAISGKSFRALSGVGLEIDFFAKNSTIDALMFVARKGFPEKLKFEVVPHGMASRKMEAKLAVDYLQCTPPLPTSWQVPEHTGESIDRNIFVPSHGFQCGGKVYGWEYIVNDVEGEAAFLIINSTYTVISRTSLIQMPNVTDGTPQYLCLPPEEQLEVSGSDLYGIAHSSSLPGDFAVRYRDSALMEGNAWPHTCGWNDAEVFLEDANIFSGNYTEANSSEQLPYLDTQKALATFRPIMNKGFVYTCACSSDSECTKWGDANMYCHSKDTVCRCREGFKFETFAYKCVKEESLALNKPAYQSSTYEWNEFFYKADLATDLDRSNDFLQKACSMTLNEATPWWVVDLGSKVEVTSVQLTTAANFIEILFAFQNVPFEVHAFNGTGTLPVSMTTVDEIKVFGPSCWRVYTSELSDTSGQQKVICSGGKEAVFSSTDLGVVGSNTRAVRKLEVYKIMHSETNICLQPNPTTQLAELMDTNCSFGGWFFDNNHLYTLGEELYGLNPSTKLLTLGYITGFDMNNAGHIVTTDTSGCLMVTGDNNLERTITGNCAVFTFQLLHTVPDVLKAEETSSLNKYLLSDPANVVANYEEILVDFNDKHRMPCVQLFTESNSTLPLWDGIAQLSEKDFRLGIEGNAWPTNSTLLTYSYFLSLPKLHDFKILIGDFFDEFYDGHFPVSSFRECANYHGNFRDGKTELIQCEPGSVGRYLVVYQPADRHVYNIDSLVENQISLCDVQVFGIPSTASGQSCAVDEDCTSAHMSCSKDKVCVCQEGFQYYQTINACFDIDECALKEDNCDRNSSTCVNEAGSFHCMCDKGLMLNPSKPTECIDDRECLNKNGGCAHICVDLAGTFLCNCLDGFQLSSNGLDCKDNDECEKEPCGNGTCINTQGSYHCICHDGYRKASFNGSLSAPCTNINECQENNQCEHKCVDTEGGYNCSCHPGYMLGENDKSCHDIDECKTTCKVDQLRCINTPGDFICVCARGYKNSAADKGICIPGSTENECLLVNGGCEHECIWDAVNMTHNCQCDNGFVLAKDLKKCDDIDECNLNGSPCDSNSKCVNEPGGYECPCYEGYELDTQSKCVDVDECKESNGGCAHICNNQIGAYKCSCRDGYELAEDGRSCEDENECSGKSGCEHECVNEAGSYYCVCREGYQLTSDDKTCKNVDECSEANGGCMHKCQDKTPGYSCSCNQGWELSKDKHTCLEDDECAVKNGGCAQICENVFGSFECSCKSGYKLDSDKASCSAENECQRGDNGGCQHICTDSKTSYTCSCFPGYKLSADKHTCVDVDECSEQKPCEHTCLNSPGSYACQCPPLSVLSEDGKTCVGVNKMLTEWTITSMPWLADYGNPTTAAAKELRNSLLKYLKNAEEPLKKLGQTDYDVTNFREGSVVFLQVSQFSKPVPPSHQSSVGLALQELAKSDNKIELGGKDYSVAETPTVIHVADDGKETRVPIEDACSLYKETEYCLDYGTCVVQDGKPMCKCLSSYSGERCEQRLTGEDDEDNDFDTVDMVVVSVLGLLFLCIIGMMLYLILFRRSLLVHTVDQTMGVLQQESAAQRQWAVPYAIYSPQQYWREKQPAYGSQGQQVAF